MPTLCLLISARLLMLWRNWPSPSRMRCWWSTILFPPEDQLMGNSMGRPSACFVLLATGEAVPRGQSLRARLLIVEVRPAEVEVFRRLQHGFDLFASGAGLQFPREFSPHIKDV